MKVRQKQKVSGNTGSMAFVTSCHCWFELSSEAKASLIIERQATTSPIKASFKKFAQILSLGVIEGGGSLVVTEAGVLLVHLLVVCIVLQIVRQKNFFFASFPQLESCIIGISIA
jgi:hypothetical protein